ncbi:MAG: CRTAC1 family protein, partial [Acidobacteria bacterium]|nr:CRTAC1 family protein [Acidobacteriota bacterium]NIO58175.1 CRTAC1 family protein [Acidobacteriota bacterium]NIQ86200.1 CRTAC1 family protein [Acidobacteriota bacterium]
ARVTASVGSASLVREIRREASYAGSVLPRAHFGLGTAGTIDRLEVRWPSGATSTMVEIEANRLLVIDEPD